jgi:hypothetical protein
VLKLISTFIGQNPILFFMIVLKKDVLLLSPQPVRSKFLKSIPFKVVLRKQCSCDVIIERVYTYWIGSKGGFSFF